MENHYFSNKTLKKRDIKTDKPDNKKALRKAQKRGHHKPRFRGLPLPKEVEDDENYEYYDIVYEEHGTEAYKESVYILDCLNNCWCSNGKKYKGYDCYISANQAFNLK